MAEIEVRGACTSLGSADSSGCRVDVFAFPGWSDGYRRPRKTARGRSFKISTADGDIGRWSAIHRLADIERERPQRQPD